MIIRKDYLNTKIINVYNRLLTGLPPTTSTTDIMSYPPRKPDERDANHLIYTHFLPTIK